MMISGTYGDANYPPAAIVLASVNGTSASVTGTFTDAGDANRWRQVVITYNQADSPRVRIYKDGERLTMFSQNTTGVMPALDVLDFGRRPDNFWYFDGRLDEVALFDRALSASEIQQLFTITQSLRFQMRSGTSTNLAARFVGFAGTTNSYLTGEVTPLPPDGADFDAADQYVQYRAFFAPSADRLSTPYLESAVLLGSPRTVSDSLETDFLEGELTTATAIYPDNPVRAYIGLRKRPNGGYYTNGVFQSRVFDAGAPATWTRMTWARPRELDPNDTSGLVALWHMNENWQDALTVHNVSGASVGYTTVAKLGSASAVFDGNDNVNGSPGSIDLGSCRALEFWINNGNAQDEVMTLRSGVTVIIENGAIRVVGQSAAVYVNGVSTSPLLIGGWNHVAIVFTGSVAVNALDVGRVGGQYMVGLLDELAFYNRALTSAEIQAHYVAGIRQAAGQAQFLREVRHPRPVRFVGGPHVAAEDLRPPARRAEDPHQHAD